MLPDILLQLHQDLADYLRQVSGLSALPVFDSRTVEQSGTGGSIQDLIDEALNTAGMQTKDGKAGLAVVVLMPDVEPANANLPGPLISLVLAVRVFENRLINESAQGFNLSASRVAVHIARSLHQWSPTGGAVLVPGTSFIADLSVPDTEGHEITFTLELGLAPEPRAAQCSIASAELYGLPVITLATSTDDAAIYYTLDGRLPGPATGTLYTVPFTVSTTAKLRALATHPDMLPSAVAEANITITD